MHQPTRPTDGGPSALTTRPGAQKRFPRCWTLQPGIGLCGAELRTGRSSVPSSLILESMSRQACRSLHRTRRRVRRPAFDGQAVFGSGFSSSTPSWGLKHGVPNRHDRRWSAIVAAPAEPGYVVIRMDREQVRGVTDGVRRPAPILGHAPDSCFEPAVQRRSRPRWALIPSVHERWRSGASENGTLGLATASAADRKRWCKPSGLGADRAVRPVPDRAAEQWHGCRLGRRRIRSVRQRQDARVEPPLVAGDGLPA